MLLPLATQGSKVRILTTKYESPQRDVTGHHPRLAGEGYEHAGLPQDDVTSADVSGGSARGVAR